MSEFDSGPSTPKANTAGSESRSGGGLPYDGPETPVLIRMPDLTAPVPPPAAEPAPVSAPPKAEPPIQQRRIHRGHTRPSGRSISARHTPADLRTKMMVVAGLIAVVGVTYVLLHGSGDSTASPERDEWAQTESESVETAVPAPTATAPREKVAAQQPGEPATRYVDLWPGDKQPPTAAEPAASQSELASPHPNDAMVKLNSAGPEEDSAAEAPDQPQIEPHLADEWPAAPYGAPAEKPQKETPVSWPDAPAGEEATQGWPSDGSALHLPGSPSHQLGTSHQGNSPDSYQRSGPSTARLDGKIEIPRPANQYESQRSTRLY